MRIYIFSLILNKRHHSLQNSHYYLDDRRKTRVEFTSISRFTDQSPSANWANLERQSFLRAEYIVDGVWFYLHSNPRMGIFFLPDVLFDPTQIHGRTNTFRIFLVYTLPLVTGTFRLFRSRRPSFPAIWRNLPQIRIPALKDLEKRFLAKIRFRCFLTSTTKQTNNLSCFHMTLFLVEGISQF